MNRRTALATAAAAAALVLAPSAAVAYEAPGYDIGVTDPSPAPGEGFEVTIDGTDIGEEYTLTITSDPASVPSSDIEIAGTASNTKVATGTSVTWVVTLASAGEFYLAVTDQSGALVADQSVIVAAAAGDGPVLVQTGFNSMGLVAGAGALVLAGAGALIYSRRRHGATMRG